MSRHRLCKACAAFHDLDEAWPLECIADADHRRSHLAAPAVRPDGMGAIRSMADGKIYDGKSAYYESVRRAGCEIVGDDRAGFGKPKTVDQVIPGGIKQSISDAIDQLQSGRAA